MRTPLREIGWCWFVLTAAVPAWSAPPAVEPDVTRFVATYCAGCHGPDQQEGDFRVDTMLKVSETSGDAEYWQLVLDNLHLDEMPPEDARQPPAADVARVIEWIEAELQRASLALGGQRGEVVLRRLNRFEYENTIADLFDVRGDYAVGFPEDAQFGGFDNNGAALTLSAEQMDQYLRAADFILGRAIVTRSRPETKSVRFTLRDITDRQRQQEAERARKRGTTSEGYTPTPAEIKRREADEKAGNRGGPFYPPFGDDMLIPVKYLKPTTKDFFAVREPGWYRFLVEAYAVRNGDVPLRLEISHGTGAKEEVATVVGVVQFRDALPKTVEQRVYLQPNQRIQLAMLDGTNWLPGSRILEDESPAIAVRRIELEGPLLHEWPPRGHRLLFGDVDAARLSDADVPNLLAQLAPKLFRRPVSDAVVAEFADFYRAMRQQTPPLEAYRLTVKAMLVSPLFLYHDEPAVRPDEYALANRLSYFLWRSCPDDVLLAAAEQGRLSAPGGLQAQAARLLADPRAERFLQDFTRQWLQTSKVGEMQPDTNLYPEYDDELERAMVQETELFIQEMFVHDLPLRNLIDSDWTMLNDRLARHYGIDGVVGNEFRRVPLDKSQTVRGGILTQASILSITSNGTTTSPVVRGVWVLERLLGTPAPAPPPDVPPIEPDIRGASTINEQLARHREIAQCNSCHRRIDPYGFGLENFDVIGGWREHYRALLQPAKGRNGKPVLGAGQRVRPAHELPRQGSFESFAEYRGLLLKNEPHVCRNVAEKLASYALGRAMTFADREPIEAIVQTTAEHGGGLRTMVDALVESPLFRQP
jgi:hypothetical protein